MTLVLIQVSRFLGCEHGSWYGIYPLLIAVTINPQANSLACGFRECPAKFLRLRLSETRSTDHLSRAVHMGNKPAPIPMARVAAAPPDNRASGFLINRNAIPSSKKMALPI